MRAISARIVAVFAALALLSGGASAQGTKGPDIVIRLRLAGDSVLLPPIRTCLSERLSKMPDIKVATAPIEGARFIVDIVAAKSSDQNLSASLVVAQTFPMEEFRPRIKEGEDADALLKNLRFYLLLRLHELIPARSSESLCLAIAADIGDKVLSKEYTERND